MDFGRLLTAMVTPFDRKGQIDFKQTRLLIEHLINNGSEGVVVAGTTGESPTLSEKEKISLFTHVVQVVNKRVPVIAGTGSNNTAQSIALTKKAEDCGIDGIMLVAPYYNKPNQQGIYEHFKAIANETDLPILMYNIPSRSVVNMSAETIIRLSNINNIVSIKESSGDLNQITKVIQNTKDDFTVYSGDDSLLLPILSIGGNGVVSVASHIIGSDISAIIQVYQQGDTKSAASLHQKNLTIINSLFESSSPAPVKEALHLLGIDVGGVRPPLVELSTEEKKMLKKNN